MNEDQLTQKQYVMMIAYCNLQLEIQVLEDSGVDAASQTLRRLQDRAWNLLRDIKNVGDEIARIQTSRQAASTTPVTQKDEAGNNNAVDSEA